MGHGPLTGVDRVELAYFRELLDRDAPVFFLCRLPKSYAVLDAAAGLQVFDKILGKIPWGPRGLARVFSARSNFVHQSAITYVWRRAILKTSPRRLAGRLKGLFPDGVTYFNVGHSNLRAGVFGAISSLTKSKIIVLIHDVIPITSPEFSTPEITLRFQSAMRVVSDKADLVIYNSTASQAEAERQFAEYGRVPKGVAAHLGAGAEVEQVFEMASQKPTFVALGTIEPRKNHALLLGIWQGFVRDLPKDQVPELHIIGRRGWNNEGVFNTLDTDPMVGQHVFEHNDLTDFQAQKMLAQSWALLFPSHAEGFGLPLVEAARRGVPIFCGQNAIYREILGDYPLYLNVDNSYVWSKRILERAGRKRESEAERQVRGRSVDLPDWNMHFDQIFRFV